MNKLLEGVTVLDLTNVLSGPFTAYQMALLGANVIKVETPGTGRSSAAIRCGLGAQQGKNGNLFSGAERGEDVDIAKSEKCQGKGSVASVSGQRRRDS